MAEVSAGLLLFRRREGRLEVFLAHPGGPFWARRDAGAWSLPKGRVEPGEALLDAARREFAEETGFTPWEGAPTEFIPLGSVRQRSGKTVHAWALCGDCDPPALKSNTMRMEYPPRSGVWIVVPEVDRGDWFPLDRARRFMLPAQAPFLDRLEEALGPR